MCNATQTLRSAYVIDRVSAKDAATVAQDFADFARDYGYADTFDGSYSKYELKGAYITETHYNAAGEVQWVSGEWGFVKCSCGGIRIYNGFNDDVSCMACGSQLDIKSRVSETATAKLRK